MAAREASEAELGLVHRWDPPQPHLRPPSWPGPRKQCLSFTGGWVGGRGSVRWAAPRVQPLFLPPTPFLLATLPCLPAPLQPRVRGPAAGDSGPGHGGAPGTVWAVRCRLLPSGLCPGTSPPCPCPCPFVAANLADVSIVTDMPMPCIPAAAGTVLAHSVERSVPCSLAPMWAESVWGSHWGLTCPSDPTEHLPQRTAGRGGWAAAGGCRADGSCAQRARPGEVRAVPLPWLPPCVGRGQPRQAPRPTSHPQASWAPQPEGCCQRVLRVQ